MGIEPLTFRRKTSTLPSTIPQGYLDMRHTPLSSISCLASKQRPGCYPGEIAISVIYGPPAVAVLHLGRKKKWTHVYISASSTMRRHCHQQWSHGRQIVTKPSPGVLLLNISNFPSHRVNGKPYGPEGWAITCPWKGNGVGGTWVIHDPHQRRLAGCTVVLAVGGSDEMKQQRQLRCSLLALAAEKMNSGCWATSRKVLEEKVHQIVEWKHALSYAFADDI